MGASAIASGRSPSIDRITTRDAKAVGVGVKVGNGVSVGVGVNVAVNVGVTLGVKVGVAVGELRNGIPPFDNWHARSTNNDRPDKNILRVLIDIIVTDSLGS
jgi:hypothetical protein